MIKFGGARQPERQTQLWQLLLHLTTSPPSRSGAGRFPTPPPRHFLKHLKFAWSVELPLGSRFISSCGGEMGSRESSMQLSHVSNFMASRYLLFTLLEKFRCHYSLLVSSQVIWAISLLPPCVCVCQLYQERQSSFCPSLSPTAG